MDIDIDEDIQNENRINHFEIKFKDNNSVFYCGDIMTGSINLELHTKTELRGIYMRIHGESFVYWQNRRTHNIFENIKNHKSYWNQLFTVWVNENLSKETSLLEPGHHSFPFALCIPGNELPSSFESKFGAIRYWIKAYIDHENYEENRYKPFTVLQKVDVNEKKFQAKISNDVEKTMCCYCFRSASIFLSAFLDRTGYCPGESIAVNCRGKNKAQRDMGGIKARLIQKVTYTAGKRVNINENIISAIGGNKIEKGRTKIWENQLLKIPAVPPSIQNCANISVRYEVQITMVVPNGVDLQFQLPVTIGTLPQKLNCQTVHVKMKRCTDGVECFNHSSKVHNFPMRAYTPFTSFVEDFVFVSKTISHKKKLLDDERQPLLLSSASANTFSI